MNDLSARSSALMLQSADTVEYLWKGRTGPFSLCLEPNVFTPTHTSMVLADALEITSRDVVIDAGCGSGVLSFVAARLGATRVFGCDLDPAAVRVAHHNARRLALEDRVEFRSGHLFEPMAGMRADVVIGDVSGMPDAVARCTGWLPGGPTGAELPVEMLEVVGDHLRPGGRCYLPTGTIQAEGTILRAAGQAFGPQNIQPVLQKQFPLPRAVGDDPGVQALINEGMIRVQSRGSRLIWVLTVWRCLRR